jgi:hypothetical protein
MSFFVGQAVKPSEYQIRPARDYWLNCGREPMKSGAKAALERLKSLRGVVIAINDGKYAKGILTISLSDGCVVRSMPSQWESAETDPAFTPVSKGGSSC